MFFFTKFLFLRWLTFFEQHGTGFLLNAVINALNALWRDWNVLLPRIFRSWKQCERFFPSLKVGIVGLCFGYCLAWHTRYLTFFMSSVYDMVANFSVLRLNTCSMFHSSDHSMRWMGWNGYITPIYKVFSCLRYGCKNLRVFVREMFIRQDPSNTPSERTPKHIGIK